MNEYKSRYGILSGTDYDEVVRKARKYYNDIRRKTKRQTYVRSQYFNRRKVFLQLFWEHLDQKNRHDRFRRLGLLVCAIDLIRNTRLTPTIKDNPNNNSEQLLRFAGQTKDGIRFFVQIKQNKHTRRKDFISVFVKNNPK